MNPFLSNLIARNLGGAPAIRPRLPSFFEPDRNRAAALPILFEQEPDASSTSMPQNSQPRVQASNAFTVSTSTHLLSESEPSGYGQLDVAGQPARPASLASSNSVIESEPRAPETRLAEQRFAAVEKFGAASRVRAVGDPKQKVVEAVSLSAKNEDAVRVPLFPQRPEGQPAPQRGHPHASISGDDLAVNVTIGKVEVRAVLPEPSSRPARAVKPRTTLLLDDYLKRRDRGRG